MPRPKKDPSDRRVQVSIKIRYFLEATAAGYADLGEYIDSLKASNRKLKDAIQAHISEAEGSK